MSKSEQLQQIMACCYVVQVARDSPLDTDFASILQQMDSQEITCTCGYIPELSDEKSVAIYFPKDMDNTEDYVDPYAGENEESAAAIKKEYSDFFNRLLSQGKLITELPS
jgi:hypothetical protein